MAEAPLSLEANGGTVASGLEDSTTLPQTGASQGAVFKRWRTKENRPKLPAAYHYQRQCLDLRQIQSVSNK